MKLGDALRVINGAVSRSAEKHVYLACGFTPLHLQTFLTAHLQTRANERIALHTGAFDDLVGNLDQMAASGASLGVCVVEWPDLDPRLGVRRLSSWTHRDFDDVASHVRAALGEIASQLRAACNSLRVVLCLPTLELLPISYTSPVRMSALEAKLRHLVAGMAAELASEAHIAVLRGGPPGSGEAAFDIESEIANGFPYRMAHADALAEAISRLGLPQPRKKGIITDLDDTLWKGILGETGFENVAWEMEHHAQVHGLYQQLLHWLSTEGVLIGVASKNSAAAVEEVFEKRHDQLLLRPEDVFPFEIHWDSKAGSVARILQQWNVAADAVVFIDDSPLELAEVAAAHPGIETLQFSANGAEFLVLWRRLRELFAADSVGAEDAMRAHSLREGSKVLEALQETTDRDAFLSHLEARMSFDFSVDSMDRRALELVNKTNQFNINGQRCDEATWAARLAAPGAFLLTCKYEDRFGSLGTIAVAQGEVQGKSASVHSWVLSCRAFSRRIEFAMLRELMRQLQVDSVNLQYCATQRNGPVRDFFETIDAGTVAPVSIERAHFDAVCPKLYHIVKTQIRLTDQQLTAGERSNA